MADLNATQVELKTATTTSQEALREKEQQLSQANEQLQIRLTETEALRSQLTSQTQTLEQVRQQLHQQQEAAETLKGQFEAALAKQAETAGMLDTFQKGGTYKDQGISQLTEQKKALEILVQEKAESLDKVLHSNQALGQKVEAQTQAMATVQQMLDARTAELTELKTTTAEQIKTLSDEKHALIDKLAASQQHITTNKEQVVGLEALANASQEALAEKEAQIAQIAQHLRSGQLKQKRLRPN
jgi:chromosome segregation ATPase